MCFWIWFWGVFLNLCQRFTNCRVLDLRSEQPCSLLTPDCRLSFEEYFVNKFPKLNNAGRRIERYREQLRRLAHAYFRLRGPNGELFAQELNTFVTEYVCIKEEEIEFVFRFFPLIVFCSKT